jgi:hypothetical protein
VRFYLFSISLNDKGFFPPLLRQTRADPFFFFFLLSALEQEGVVVCLFEALWWSVLGGQIKTGILTIVIAGNKVPFNVCCRL